VITCLREPGRSVRFRRIRSIPSKKQKTPGLERPTRTIKSRYRRALWRLAENTFGVAKLQRSRLRRRQPNHATDYPEGQYQTNQPTPTSQAPGVYPRCRAGMVAAAASQVPSCAIQQHQALLEAITLDRRSSWLRGPGLTPQPGPPATPIPRFRHAGAVRWRAANGPDSVGNKPIGSPPDLASPSL